MGLKQQKGENMKNRSELSKEIESLSNVHLEYIDWVELFDSTFEEIYYVTDPIHNRFSHTIKLVIITNTDGKQSYVASVGMTQIPSIKFHTHDQFMDIINKQEEFPLGHDTIKEGSFEEMINFADVFMEWWLSYVKKKQGTKTN